MIKKSTALKPLFLTKQFRIRIVARKSSIGGLYVYVSGFEILKI